MVTMICVAAGLWAASPVRAQQPSSPGTPPGASAQPPAAKRSGEQLVSIDFNNVDIGVLIKFISDLTKKNFIVDDKVRGKVTIISPGKITVAEAYRVFESVLEVYGYTTVPSGSITKIVPSPEARSKSIKTRLQEEAGTADDAVITQIIPLRYADPNEIKNLFTPLVSRNSVIQAYAPTNTLIITDVHSNIKRLLSILKAIDITGVGQQIAIIPVENASAAKMVTLLQSVFKPSAAKGRTAGARDITFVADERTNSIVVLASEGEVDNIRQLIASLDEDTPKGQGNINVYYLEHATAEDIAKVLQDIPQKSNDAQQAGKPTAPVVSSKVRITADKATNSLIITAEPDDYLVLEAIIRKIDIPRAMVYIEALIMEVNVTKDFELGTEWRIGEDSSIDGKDVVYGGGFSGESSIISGTTAGTTFVPTLPSGFALGVFGEALSISGITFPSIQAVVNAYKKDRDVRILSTPQILTTDNQEAKIYVGKNIPFQTTATLSTSSAGEVYNSFEYRDVGKTLKITPQISKDRMVRLLLSLEVTALESSVDNRPTTLKRTIETTAIVRDGHSVVLGGLIDDTQGATVYKVPCLGDIPGIGYLFSTRSTGFDKSNLYVFMTPRVIQKPDEIKAVSRSKREEIEKLRSKNIDLFDRNDPPPMEDLQIPAPEGALDEAPADRQSMSPVDSDRQNPASATSDAPIVPAQGTSRIEEQAAAGDTTQADATIPSASYAQTSTVSPADIENTTNTSASAPRVPSPVVTTAQETTRVPHATGAAAPANARAGGERPIADTSTIAGYTMQVASVQDPDKAAELLQELTGKGYAAYTVRSEINGKTWYRLRIGYFASQTDAEQMIQRLKTDAYDPILIKL